MINGMDKRVKAYLSAIGRRGGRNSRRTLDPQAARAMVQVREARRAYRSFHKQCFWSFDPNYVITASDTRWVGEQLMKYGGQQGWRIGAKLCR